MQKTQKDKPQKDKPQTLINHDRNRYHEVNRNLQGSRTYSDVPKWLRISDLCGDVFIQHEVRLNQPFSECRQGPIKGVLVYDHETGGFLRSFDNNVQTAVATGVSRATISRCARGTQTQSKGYVFRYKDYIKGATT